MTIPPNTPGFWNVNAVTVPSTVAWQPMSGMAFAPSGQSSGNSSNTV